MKVSRTLAASLVVGAVVAMANTSSASLMAYYAMNESINPSIGTSVLDSSGNAKNGIMASDSSGTGATVGVASANAGLYGTAYNFSPLAGDTDYVDVFPSPAFTFLTRDGALTYAAWIKPNATQAFANPTMIGTTGGSFGFRIAPSGPNWNLRLQSDNTATSTLTSTATIPSDVWTHVAVTKDINGSAGTNLANVSFYINGVLADSGTIPRAGSGNSIVRLFLGTGALATQYYSGGLDEVHVYNEVLDANAIAALAVVPEPSAVVLAFMGISGLVGVALRKRVG